MAGTQGRTFILKVGNAASPEVFTTIAGLTTKNIALSNGTLDVTTDDSAGIKTLLAGKYGVSASISASGVAQDVAGQGLLRDYALAGTAHNFTLDNPASSGGDTYSGSFIVTSYTETGETNDAITFEISLESAGAVTVA